jgi:hypothetical protein
MFFRVKRAGSYQYLQIVHSVREGQKVRQQVFATLGRIDELKASGRLDALMRSGLRHCENLAVIDAHAAGQTEPVTVLRIGPELVFGRLWKESGIQEVVQSLLHGRRYDFDVERAIYLTVLHRLFASGSDRAAERWRENYLIPGTEALDLHHLYRAMAFLGQEIEPKGQKILGTPRCLKDLIEEELFDRRRDLLLKWTWSFSTPPPSTLKAVAESQSVSVVTIRITGPIFTRWSSAWPWTSRVDRSAARCGRATRPTSKLSYR